MKNVKFWVLLCAVMITAMFCQSNAAAQNNQEQLLYERINSYLVKKQYREAENALDTAISRYPTNLVLYIVKGNMYMSQYTALKEDYKVVLDKISSLKETLRNNASEKTNVESELASQEKVAAVIKSDFMTNLNKATDCYKQVLAKDANNYEANFQLGIVSYDKAEIVQIEKGEIYPWEDRDGSQIAAKDKELHAYWKESSEWFEMAHKAKPTKYDPIQNLKVCYYKLGDTANWNRVKVELDKLKSGEVIASASDNTAKTTTQTANNNVSSAATTSTAPAYSQAEYERKCNEIKREYGNNWQSVEERVREYEKNIESVVRAYISAIGWNGNSRMDLTNAYLTSQLNVAVSISKKTIDPQLVKRLDVSFGRLYGLKHNYDTDFSEVFWRDVYPAVAKNNKSLDFEIFYVETFHDIFRYNNNRPDYRYRTDYSVINRVSDEITRTSDRERQVYLYSEYIKLCRMANEAGKQLTINTSLSAPICKSFVDEIINTRSSQIIAKYDNITKGWPNYQSDIYNPTEEVRLYNRLRDLEAKNTRDLFAIIDPYIQKYSNSGNDITYLVLKNFESMKDEESANAIITMIHNHGDYIKQNVNFDTKLNDLLYSRLSSLDAKESIKIADNLINNNASYMQSHLAYDTKIQALYLAKLAELDEGKRNEHIFDAIAQNKKYADKMKQKFRTVESAYTWIKNNSSASYQWTGMIDKYLSCFPTSVHKTELSKLRSTLMDRIREREEDDRSRAEAAAASRNAAAANNPKRGDYVQFEAKFDCGWLCTTPPFIITGYVTDFRLLSGTAGGCQSLTIEVSSVSSKRDIKYTDTDWGTVNKKAKKGEQLNLSCHCGEVEEYQNLTILRR